MMGSNIPTVILCGGMGTRMKEETEYRPKPMVEIGGQPMLWHIMKIYGHYGYGNFLLALGYKGGYIKDYFLRQKHYTYDFALNTKDGSVSHLRHNNTFAEDDFRIIFADTGLETPHGERVLKLKNYLQDHDLFMVTYGDGVADIDLDELVAFHRRSGVMATITGVHPSSRWGLVKVDDANLVTQFVEKPQLYDYVNGGFMVFKREFLDVLKEGDLIEDGLGRLIPQKQLALYRHEGFWYGMDTYKDLVLLNELWEKDPKWKIWH